MPHSELYSVVSRLMRIGAFAQERDIRTGEALDIAARQDERILGRRRFIGQSIGAAAALTAATRMTIAAPRTGQPRIAIVGGGLGGLVCADWLRSKGLAATIYEASSRVGGRCYSLRGFFPGQTAERGGEFIDTTHQTMRAYATEFGLAREDVTRGTGSTIYHFFGNAFSEEEVVNEFRTLVPRMRADLQTCSGEPSFFAYNAGDLALDRLSLREWLATRANDLPIIRAVLDEAYLGEYGLETDRQSALNLLLFIHADRRGKFKPFGVFSDERFHIVGGNDAIASNIAQRLPGPIMTNHRLTSLSKRTNGEFELRCANGRVAVADYVVLALPFSVLRTVTLDASLGLSSDKVRAINTLGYGMNAKTMVGFNSRPWDAVGCSGSVYADQPNVQTVWETNPIAAANGGVLTDYASGDRGVAIGGLTLQTQVSRFLGDLNAIIPGAQAAATRLSGNSVRAFREHWPSNPLSRGSYTCYEPGQFTTIAGLEGQPSGRVKFAGEHTDSFYSWQGFMEGACLSGLRAAGEVWEDIRRG
ncbi:MAG: flavin monoamine oxidase family protein [Phycisphaerales bacterium]